MAAIANPNGYTTSYTYDAAGRETASIDPLGNVTTDTYDADGEITAVTDPDGNVTTTSYDADGRTTGSTNPNGYRTTYTYDSAGEVTSMTDADGRLTGYAYDADGRLVTENWMSGGSAINTITHTYDADGETTSLTDAAATLTFTYDADGELTSQATSSPGGQPDVTLTNGYDPSGNRTTLADNLSAAGLTTFSYDSANRLTTIAAAYGGTAGPNVGFGYDAANRLTSLSRTIGGTGTAVTSAYGYDDANRLTTITHGVAGGSTLATDSYLYDVAGRLLAQSNAEGLLTYTYDPTDQIIATNGPAAATYTYDDNGNRTMTGYATSTGNELTSGAGYTYTYDNVGNLVSKTQLSTGDVWAYSYDYHNNLTGVVEDNASGSTLMAVTYVYDPLDRRIGVIAGTTTWSVYDGLNVYADFDASGTLLTRYLDGPAVDEILARTAAAGTTAWYLTDDQGSVRDIVNASGTVIDHLAYDSFGNVLSESSPTNGDRFKFNGMQFDSAIDAYYDNARYYDPVTGRFFQEDPTGFMARDANLYRFVGNGPTNATDPTGLDGQPNQPGSYGGFFGGLINLLDQVDPNASVPVPQGVKAPTPEVPASPSTQQQVIGGGPAGRPSLANGPYDLTSQGRLTDDQLHALGVVSGYRSGNTYYYFKSKQREQQFRDYLNGQAAPVPPAATPQAGSPAGSDPSQRLDNLMGTLDPVFASGAQKIEEADKALQAAGVPKSGDPVGQAIIGATPLGTVQDVVDAGGAVVELAQNPNSNAAWLTLVAALLGFFPFADILKTGRKAGRKVHAPNNASPRPDKIDELVAAAKPSQRDLAPVPDRVRPQPTQPKPTPPFGAKGTQTPSKTLWKGEGKSRIDVENPNPGQRPGQIHYQDNVGGKYLYDPATNSFPGAPRSVNELLNDPAFRNGINKAMQFLGES